MAFNPFKSFRKNQKFWMSLVILLSMVTFVLCTGVGGDLSDFFIRLFGNRKGNALAKLNGHNVYIKDLQDLRVRRNAADLFMRKATQESIGLLTKLQDHDVKQVPESKRGEFTLRLRNLKEDLQRRLLAPRYFSGGVKHEDLINFMLWLQQADRLGITLESQDLVHMVDQAIHARDSGFDTSLSRKVETEVRNTNPNLISDQTIYAALRDEFRVQIAQLALMESRLSEATERRRPLSPEQIWEDYRKQCASFDVALVPVPVDDFLAKVPAPSEAQLQELYEANRNNEYNPTLDRPSFKFPARMQAQWVSADPESKRYQNFAKIWTTFENRPGIGGNMGVLAAAPWGPLEMALQAVSWDASLERNYERAREKNPEPYVAPSLTAPNFALELANRLDKGSPAAAAALVGSALRPVVGFAAPLAYEADIYLRHQREVARALPALVKPRVPIAASVVLASASSSLLPICLWNYAQERPEMGWQVQYLPLDLVRKEFQAKLELQRAQEWIVSHRVMVKVKDQLSKPGTAGKKEAFDLFLPELMERYGLTMGKTDKFYNRYDIAKAPGLQPLRKSFEKYLPNINIPQGVAGQPEKLKADEFWRLFFDSSISYSVENAGLYVTKPWPPIVKTPRSEYASTSADREQTLNLFELSGHPFLFWQTAFEPARAPKSLDEVRDKVVTAYKEIQAREKFALPRAKEIALELQRAGKDLPTALTQQAAKLGHNVIDLRGVALLVASPTPKGERRTYGPYELPRDSFLYPRDDMVKELLTLNDLSIDSKTAIKTGNKELDDLNEELLKRKVPGKHKQIQVLANKPRTVFYVAAITRPPEVSPRQFLDVLEGAGYRTDEFVDFSQREAGQAYQAAIIAQLRQAAKYEPLDNEALKGFDGGGD